MSRFDDQWIRVEMRADVLQDLMAKGQACAAGFRCLDARSKESLWRLCLDSCRTCRCPKRNARGSCSTCGNTKCNIKHFLTKWGSAKNKEVDGGGFSWSNTDK